ncbi:uncharacterized protein M421DRAFT_77834, partial [Didymella exigua CBS 183.55]
RPSGYMSDTGSQGQASGSRNISSNIKPVSPSLDVNRATVNTSKGSVDDNGGPKDATPLLETKLDLEAEIT